MATSSVILKEKIENLGGEGDVVAVRRGFARNFLIPQGKAYEATKGNLRHVEALAAKKVEREAKELAEAEKIAGRIRKQRVELTLSTGQGGKAFGSITVANIIEAVKEKCNIELEKRVIILPGGPIKTTGKQELEIRLHPDVECSLKINVTSEGGDEAAADDEAAAPAPAAARPAADSE